MIRIKRLIKSFIYAFRGLVKAFREEQNLRIQAVMGIIVLATAWYFGVTRMEWCILILTIGIVMLTEIINTAIELVTDVLKPRIDNYVKVIKDVMAAAVMMSSVMAVVIGLIIFIPYLLEKFGIVV